MEESSYREDAIDMRHLPAVCATCSRSFYWVSSVGRRECFVHPHTDGTMQAFPYGASWGHRAGVHICCRTPLSGSVMRPATSDPAYLADVASNRVSVSRTHRKGCYAADHHTVSPGYYQRHGDCVVDVPEGQGGMISCVPGPVIRDALRCGGDDDVMSRLSEHAVAGKETAVHIDDPRMVAVDCDDAHVIIHAGGVEHRCSVRGAFFHLAAKYGFSDKPGRLTLEAYADSRPSIGAQATEIESVIESLIGNAGDDGDGGDDAPKDMDKQGQTQSPSDDILDHVRDLIDNPTSARSERRGATTDDDAGDEILDAVEDERFVDFYIYSWVSPCKRTHSL